MPADLLRHYLRGYMDGDGGFYFSRLKQYPNRKPSFSFSIAGTKAFCLAARDYLVDTIGVSRPELGHQDNLWKLGYYSQSAGRVHDLLYEGATVYLARKKVEKPTPGYFTVNASRLAEIRRARDLTQDELCERAGLSQQTVWRLESGWARKDRGQGPLRGVHIDTLNKLADALDVSPRDLMGD